MSRRIAPIFLPNIGCPHRCIFCNERIAAGRYPARITREQMAQAVSLYIGFHAKKEERQIAFYGGNFTGIDLDYQHYLLKSAKELVESGWIDSIRLSTRPDCINKEILEDLRRFPVRTIEIGAQSMVDTVLKCSLRGHTSEDTGRAVELLKEYGFETGVHLMMGLPGDDWAGLNDTVDQIIALGPDMVRIHPTLVLEGTELAEMYKEGSYLPLDMDETVRQCRYVLSRFRQAGIDVIRIGLQTTSEMNEPGAVLAGPFHPAFRSLVEGSIFLETAERLLSHSGFKAGQGINPEFFVSAPDISDFRGIGNRNMVALKERFGLDFKVKPDATLDRGEIILEAAGKRFYSNRLQRAT